jgi:hypothetical protein
VFGLSGHSVVFLGPTLPQAEARRWLDAEFLPPGELGDVWRVSQELPAAIGIVDGYFHQVPAVSHKEILYALSRGIAVYGAASMGALRAAELSAFGMVGVGAIAAGYASGELDADDEVALLHAPAEFGYKGLSEPLVNIRATLAAMQRDGVVSATTAERLLRLARSLPYADRAWPRLLDAVPDCESHALAAWLPAGRVDQKREDATAMLERMRADSASCYRDKQAPPAFFPTVLWQELVQRETPFVDIVDEFLLLDPLPHEVGAALGLVRSARHVEGCAALSSAPEWPICCRRARLKRNATRGVEPSEADADRLLSWFFGERLGWPADLSAFLRARGWTNSEIVLGVAAREAAFLSASTGDAFDAPALDRAVASRRADPA